MEYNKLPVAKQFRGTCRVVVRDDQVYLLCTKCGQYKPETDFHRSCNSPTKKGYWCKQCRREYEREYRKKSRQLSYKGGSYQILTCEFCGNEFKVSLSELNRLKSHGKRRMFCSMKCSGASRRVEKKKTPVGPRMNPWDNPNYPRKRRVCKFLKKHETEFKDDPERLSVDFLRTMFTTECKDEIKLEDDQS